MGTRWLTRRQRQVLRTPAHRAVVARAGRTPSALGSCIVMTTTPDPNNDPALAGEAPETADDAPTSTEQLLEDAEGAIAASTLDAPDI
jgi:hypothetical protein